MILKTANYSLSDFLSVSEPQNLKQPFRTESEGISIYILKKFMCITIFMSAPSKKQKLFLSGFNFK